MKYIFFLHLLLFTHFQIYSQNLTGKWLGILQTHTQNTDKPEAFFMEMEIRQTGDQIQGQTRVNHQNGKHGRYSVKGISGKQNQFYFSLTDNTNLTRESSEVPNFFLELTNITYSGNDTAQMLYGKWLSGSGIAGNFWARKIDTLYDLPNEEFVMVKDPKIKKIKDFLLKLVSKVTKPKSPVIKTELPKSVKAPYEKRKNIIKDTLTVPRPEITLELYDNGEIDGDSVSVYLNDAQIVMRRELKSEPIKMQLTLEKNKKYVITLFAENLGTIPPNTAVLIIKSESYEKVVYLSADYGANASVVIKLK